MNNSTFSQNIIRCLCNCQFGKMNSFVFVELNFLSGFKVFYKFFSQNNKKMEVQDSQNESSSLPSVQAVPHVRFDIEVVTGDESSLSEQIKKDMANFTIELGMF